MTKISILKQIFYLFCNVHGAFLLLSLSILTSCFLDSATNRVIPVTSGKNGVNPGDTPNQTPGNFPIQADRVRIAKDSICACNNLSQNLTPRQRCRLACAKLSGLGNIGYATYQLGSNYKNKSLAEVCGGGNTGYQLCRFKYSNNFSTAPDKWILSDKLKFLDANVLAFTIPQEFLNDARNQFNGELQVYENNSWRPFTESNYTTLLSNAYGKANFIYNQTQFVTLFERMSAQSYIVPKVANDPNCSIPFPFNSPADPLASACAHTTNDILTAATAFYYGTTSNFATTQVRRDEPLPIFPQNSIYANGPNNNPIKLLSMSSSNTSKIYDAVGSTSFQLVINELIHYILKDYFGYTGTPNTFVNTYFRYLPAADSMGDNISYTNQFLNPDTFFPNPVPYTQNSQNPIEGPNTGIVDNVTYKGVYLNPIEVAPSVFGNGNKKACPNRALVNFYDHDELNAVNFALGNPVLPTGKSDNSKPESVSSYPFYYLCREPRILPITPKYDPIIFNSINEVGFKTVRFKIMSIEEIKNEVIKTNGIKYELEVDGQILSAPEKNALAAISSINDWASKIEQLFITTNGNLRIRDAFGNRYHFMVPGSPPNLATCESPSPIITDPIYGCYFK